MNKKIVGLGLAAVATLALGACSRSNSSSSSSKSSVKAAIVTDTGGVDDKSFNQSAWEGMQAWGKENKLKKDTDYTYFQSDSESDYATNLDSAVSNGYNLVFAIGYNLHDAVDEAAPQNKDTNYVIIDDVVADHKNVESVLFADNEGAYLAGIAAAMQSKTKHVGFVGGVESDTITRFETGFNQAAQDILQTDQTCLGKDVLQILRNLALNNWLEKGLQGRKQEGVLQLDDAHYKVMVRPIHSEDKVTGLAILFFDVTEQLQAEQLRREFTANVSHELKTPLHLISGYSEMLASDVVAQKDIPQFAEKIHSESQRMIQLVEDIIKLSHLDESEELAMEPVNLYQISEEVLDSLSAKANERHINLHLLGEPAYITGNHALIHSLIYNLCDNAIIYNRDKGDVTVDITSNEDDIVLTVQDTGVGIAKDEQERIFERFYRVDKSRSKKLGGTGLGLSIVKHAVNQHHADIKVESQLGLGTKMTVTFYK